MIGVPSNSNPNKNSAEFNALFAKLSGLKQKVSGIFSEEFISYIDDIIEKAEKLEDLRKGENIQASRDIRKITEGFTERIRELAGEAKRLEQMLIALQEQPPLMSAKFVRFVRYQEFGEGYKKVKIPVVDIINASGSSARVFVHPELDVSSVKYGQRVLVSAGNMTVMEILDEFEVIGQEAYIEALLEPDFEGRRVLVSEGQLDMKMVVHLSSSVADKEIEEGTRVLVDTRTSLVVEILPEHESRRYIVGEIPDVTFADIGGLDDIIQRIDEHIIWPIMYPEIWEKIDLESPKGFVLAGPPGVGKTMIAKALVNRLNEKLAEVHGKPVKGRFFHIAGPELQNKFVGETERIMREIFAQAAKNASSTSPSLIFFDEADALLPRRGSGISSDVEKTNVTQFTALMDGLEARNNIIVVLATNRSELLDPAVIRPGRSDFTIDVPRPNEEAAKAIFAKYIKPEWGQINPKYDEELYTPRDRNGDPRVDESGNMVKLYFNHNPKEAVKYLISKATARMYDPENRSNEFIHLRFTDHSEKVLRYGDFASGAMIKNIVDRAKKFSIRDHRTNEEELGIKLAHLYKAIEEVFSELRGPAGAGDPSTWLEIEGHARGKNIVAGGIKFLSNDESNPKDDDYEEAIL